MTKSIGYYSLRYVGFALIVSLVLIALVYATYALAPDLAVTLFEGRSGLGVVSVIVPALLVGQVFYRHEQRKMTRGESWLMAFLFMVLAFVVNGVIVVLSGLLVPLSAAETDELTQLWQTGRDVILIVFAIFAVVLVLMNKVMFWSAIRGEIKGAERRAAKVARKG